MGLHASPAQIFCKAAAAQPAKVSIAAGDRGPVDARSILSVLSLGVNSGEVVLSAADGAAGEAALDALGRTAGHRPGRGAQHLIAHVHGGAAPEGGAAPPACPGGSDTVGPG